MTILGGLIVLYVLVLMLVLFVILDSKRNFKRLNDLEMCIMIIDKYLADKESEEELEEIQFSDTLDD